MLLLSVEAWAFRELRARRRKKTTRRAIKVSKTRTPITIPAIAPPDRPPAPLSLLFDVLPVMFPVGKAGSAMIVTGVPEMVVVTRVVAVAAMDAEAESNGSVGVAGALDMLGGVLGAGVEPGGRPVAPIPFSSITLMGPESAVCVPWIKRRL